MIQPVGKQWSVNCCHQLLLEKNKIVFWAGYVPHLAHIPGTHGSPRPVSPSNAASSVGLLFPTALLCLAVGPGRCPMPVAGAAQVCLLQFLALCARISPKGHPWKLPCLDNILRALRGKHPSFEHCLVVHVPLTALFHWLRRFYSLQQGWQVCSSPWVIGRLQGVWPKMTDWHFELELTISESQGSAEKNESTEEKNENTELQCKIIQHEMIKNQQAIL